MGTATILLQNPCCNKKYTGLPCVFFLSAQCFLLSAEFYGFIDDENEGDESEQARKEKSEGFSIPSDPDTHKTITFAGGRKKKDERHDREIPKREFPPREIHAFFEEIEGDEKNKSNQKKKKQRLQKT
jgi:hypothetical protein